MTIVLGNKNYFLKDFLFKKVVLTQDYASFEFANAFLTEWISGGKAFEIYTSGSTGEPKKIILKRKWLETSALQTIEILNLWNENTLCCIPTNKIGGLMMIVRSLAGGFNLQISEPKADPMFDLPANHTFTFVSLVPYQLRAILNSKKSIEKLNRFKNILLGGSGIPDDILKKIKNLSPTVYHTYGMTETCSHIALKKLNDREWKHFKPNPFVEFKTDKDGILSVKAFQTGDEWMNTKDIVKLYKNGDFDFLGRADFLINTGGFKIFPELLEEKIKKNIIQTNFDVTLFITSKHSQLWGEELILVLDYNFKITDVEILKILKPILLKQELPKHILRVESFPLNESGKINRLMLREVALQSNF